MARDYAKPRNPNAARKGGNSRGGRGGRGGPSPRGGGGGGGALPGWVWLAVGLAIGAVVAAFAYIEKPQHRTRLGQDVAREGAEASPLVGQNRPAATARDGKDEPAAKGRERGPDKASPKDKDKDKTDGKAPAAAPGNADVDRRYTFYNELQKIEVPIPREYAQPPPAGKTPPKPPPPEIREALSSPGAYLIQVGAYKSREEADRQRARLALLGYESRIEQGSSGTGLVFRVRIGPQSTLAAAQAVTARLDGNGIGSYLIKLKD